MNLRTQVQHDLTEAQALDGLMSALKESIKNNANIVSNGNYINAEPSKNKHMMPLYKMLKI